MWPVLGTEDVVLWVVAGSGGVDTEEDNEGGASVVSSACIHTGFGTFP